MAFSDHKIAAFTHKITDLPDQPNLPADELKARFDSSPEELRQSLNAVCDDADRLDDRVSGIIAETFGDTIDRSMLSDEFEADLDGMEESIDGLTESVAQKCEVYFGSYTGTGGGGRIITLPANPKVAFINDAAELSTCIGLKDATYGLVRLSGNEMMLSNHSLNENGRIYFYACFC